MAQPRVRSGRLGRVATLLMIALGVFTILVNLTIAVIIIVLGVAMYLFDWWMARRLRRGAISES